MTLPDKRPAFEPAERLLRPTGYDPDMKRPITTAVGAGLVLLGVAAEAFVLAAIVLQWDSIVSAAEVMLDGVTPSDVSGYAMWAVILVMGAFMALEVVFAILVYRGLNWPRVVVMFFAVFTISVSFATWWAEGQEIRVTGTLVSVAADVLVLLALSSRSAAAYARRNQRR